MFLELQKIIVIRRSELSLHEFYVCRLLDSFMNMPAILISSVGIEYFLPPICASLSMLLSHLTSDTHTLFDLSTCKRNSNTTSVSFLYSGALCVYNANTTIVFSIGIANIGSRCFSNHLIFGLDCDGTNSSRAPFLQQMYDLKEGSGWYII